MSQLTKILNISAAEYENDQIKGVINNVIHRKKYICW